MPTTSSPVFRLRKFLLVCYSLLLIAFGSQAQTNPQIVASPDKKLIVQVAITADKKAVYRVQATGKPVLQDSRLGLRLEDQDFTQGLSLVSASKVEPVSDSYELFTGKKRKVTYKANKRVFHLKNATGQPMDVIFQVSNDGV